MSIIKYIRFQEKAGQEPVIRLDNITCDAMERLLFAVCPTIYGQYPIPPTGTTPSFHFI